MSRSKKAPFWRDPNDKAHKRKANKKVKRAKDVKSGGAFKKEYCSWNISDYSFYSPDDPKATRK